MLPAEHPLAPAATVEAETQPATRTCFLTMEAGTDRLHPRRQPKIANAMKTQILGPKVPNPLALKAQMWEVDWALVGTNWEKIGENRIPM